MNMASLLVFTILLPMVGAILVACLGSLRKPIAKWLALATTLTALVGVAIVISNAPNVGMNDSATDYAVTDYDWLSYSSGVNIRFHVGLDGVSLWLYGLSALLLVSAVLVSWTAIDNRPALFYFMLLMLETGCLGVFAARDIVLFYVFFEFTLIPLFFLIGIWGSEQRRYAAAKFFLYTLAGSLLTFVGLLSIVIWDYTQQPVGQQILNFSIPELTRSLNQYPLPTKLQLWVFVALFAGFAIKVPLFPLHTWLPLAHVQAPTAGSVILAGILLKIGTYGFVRFSIPMLPNATTLCMPWLLWLSVTGIIFGALVALAQSDIKRLIAYSSVSHLGFCMLGLFALNRAGNQGAILQMVNHGLSTGALFAMVGMIYERYHTREIGRLGGLARRMPRLAFFLLLFTFSSIGLPGLNGFAGEFLVLLGMFQRAWAGAPSFLVGQLRVISVLALLGVVLGAWYMLWLIQRTFFGSLREPVAHGSDIADLNLRELLALAPLAFFVVWIGVQPNFFLNPIAKSIDPVTDAAQQPLRRADLPSGQVARIRAGSHPAIQEQASHAN